MQFNSTTGKMTVKYNLLLSKTVSAKAEHYLAVVLDCISFIKLSSTEWNVCYQIFFYPVWNHKNAWRCFLFHCHLSVIMLRFHSSHASFSSLSHHCRLKGGLPKSLWNQQRRHAAHTPNPSWSRPEFLSFLLWDPQLTWWGLQAGQMRKFITPYNSLLILNVDIKLANVMHMYYHVS